MHKHFDGGRIASPRNVLEQSDSHRSESKNKKVGLHFVSYKKLTPMAHRFKCKMYNYKNFRREYGRES